MQVPSQASARLPDQEIALLLQTNSELAEHNRQLQAQIESLTKQLEWFKRQVFGRTSEKRLVEEIPGQGQLFAPIQPPQELPRPTEQIQYERKKPVKDRGDALTDCGLRFDESVEVKEIRIPAPQLQGPDADQYVQIDEHITYRLGQRRSSYVVLKYIQPVVKHKFNGTITTQSAPRAIFEKSIADVSFLVGIVIDKFQYYQPLYRQHQKLSLSGITISRTTLTNYVHRTAFLLKPIYEAMLRNILQSKVLAMDETPTKAGNNKKGKMQQAWYWPLLGDQDEIAFPFARSRGRQVVDELLVGFEGTLVTDGYSVYRAYVNANAQVQHAQDWMHNRRNYVYAEHDEPEAVAQALEIIGALFAHEQKIKQRKLDDAAKLKYRSEHCKPVVDRFFDWVEAQRQRLDLLPKSPFAEALQYSVNHVAALQLFLTDPRIPIDTGALERGLRPIPMGQKSWLFNWTEVGAQYAGILQSLIVTCRMHGINPTDYLIDVLQRVDQHPASAIDELTPRLWKQKYGNIFFKSDVDR